MTRKTSCSMYVKSFFSIVAKMTESDSNWNESVPVQDSATLRIGINLQKIRILTMLNDLLKERRSFEHARNSLLQSAVLRQHQVQELRDKCDAAWEQKLSLARASGSKVESECTALRERRDTMQKQLIATIDGNMPCKAPHISPSIRANYKIQATLLQKDIAELKRRVLHAKLRLDTEIKGIDKLSNIVKKLRVELGTKKLNSMSIRPQTLALLKHANECRSSRENFRQSILKNTARTTMSVTTPRGKKVI